MNDPIPCRLCELGTGAACKFFYTVAQSVPRQSHVIGISWGVSAVARNRVCGVLYLRLLCALFDSFCPRCVKCVQSAFRGGAGTADSPVFCRGDGGFC